MNPRTSLSLSNGTMIDLLDPRAEAIDFKSICEHLSKANRYCGATPGLTYSVAEHSVRCAVAGRVASNDQTLGAYLLCHDMHEAFLGDDTTPKKRALEAIAAQFGVLSEHVQASFDGLVFSIDAVIHEAAGLQWPMPENYVAAVKRWDRILLATEWRDLMKCPPPYDFGVEPLEEKIEPIDWQGAGRLMWQWCQCLLPNPYWGQA